MRVLVTRPIDSARRTAGRLASMGHEAVLFPLSKAEHFPETVAAALQAPHWAIAVTSAEALRAMALLGTTLEQHLHERLFAVGEATAEAARHAGFRDVLVGNGTGAELAVLVATHNDGDYGKPLLYLAGRPRSAAFEDGLCARAIPVVTAEVYEMIALPPENPDKLLNPPADALLLYSKEHARLFFSLASVRQNDHRLRHMAVCCISRNVADAVPDDFRHDLRIAQKPDEPSLLDLL